MASGASQAVPMIEIVPATSTVTVGDLVSVDVMVSGLVDEYVGTYDLTLAWDSALLALQGVAFDVFLDGPADSLASFVAGPGTVSVFEVSLGMLLNQSGNGAFRLFSLTFDALAAGSASLAFSGDVVQLLGDALGAGYGEVALSPARVSIEPRGGASVPEPGPLALMLVGLAALAGRSSRRVRRG
jgi:hypothetical protein